MVEVRNVQELLKYVYRNTDACLEVIGKNGKKTWEENKGSVTLNIGFKKFPVISRECFEKISDRLKCRKEPTRDNILNEVDEYVQQLIIRQNEKNLTELDINMEVMNHIKSQDESDDF